MYSNISVKTKFMTLSVYFILSIPYLYLLYKWNGIVPPATQLSNPKTTLFMCLINLMEENYFNTYKLTDQLFQ